MKYKKYKFTNNLFPQICFIHPSYRPNLEFQRLEFLGDKVLSFHLSELLYKFNMDNKDKLTEGNMSLMLANLVNSNKLATIGIFLKNKIKFNSKLNDSILSDCFEAWLGAVYLDGGNVKQFIEEIYTPILQNSFFKNPKNLIQELAQEKKLNLSYEYKQVENSFIATIILGDLSYNAQCTSKKTASIKAAQLMLDNIAQVLVTKQDEERIV